MSEPVDVTDDGPTGGAELRVPRRSVTTVRPRRGDLEAATHPHPFRPSGEHAGASWAEVCDLCGLAQRGPRTMHPEGKP